MWFWQDEYIVTVIDMEKHDYNITNRYHAICGFEKYIRGDFNQE